ncbi:MAG: VOC family protein [Bacteroidota bacterium]
MKRVTGIGGIFFRSKDTAATKKWYETHLGIQMDKWGSAFEWRQAEDANLKGFTQWSPMSQDTEYFGNPDQQFMVNYRVKDLEGLVETLKAEGVTIVDKIQTFDYGKFVHILDGDGRRIELWEPVDEVFDQYAEGRTK